MGFFYFHLRSAAGVERDDMGLEFSDLETAYLEACRAIPALSADLLAQGRNPMNHAFEITDAEGTLLLDVPFTETLRNGHRAKPTAVKLVAALTPLERTQGLAAEVQNQIDALRKSIFETRVWIDQHSRS